MIIPLSTDRPLARPTLVTYGLMAVCIGVHLARVLLTRSNPEAAQWLMDFGVLEGGHRAVGPEASTVSAVRWWEFFTYQFLHGGLMHLLGNMLFLFVFGPAVEDRLRRWGFLAFYLIGGASAGMVHRVFVGEVLTEVDGVVVTGVPGVIGASGSIACVTGAYLVLFPLASIRVLFFFFVIGIYHLPAWLMIVAAIVKDLWSSAWTGTGGAGVAFEAHLGGYVFGAAVAFALLAIKVLPRETYDLFSMGKQAHRRRVFKELASGKNSPWLADAAKSGPAAKASRAHADEEQARQLAEKRGEIVKLLSSGQGAEAADRYAQLLEAAPGSVMPRAAQSELASQFYRAGRHALAAQAFELFLKRYPSDREASETRLMLAAINARYLNDPVRAKTLIAEAKAAGLVPERAAFADELSRDLG
ncbi:MAG: rhomboid family intramembrane serine protease [Phycisphaerales bacterium]